MTKNKTAWTIALVVIVLIVMQSGEFGKKLAGETVVWSAPSSVLSGEVFSITATPSNSAELNSWVVENIVIPNGWSFHSVAWSGGNGLGADGCGIEGNLLSCATAGSNPAAVRTQLILRFNTPLNPVQGVSFNGDFVTINVDTTTNPGSLAQLSVDVTAPGCTPSTVISDCGADTSCQSWSCPAGECISSNVPDDTSCGSGQICQSGVCTTVDCTQDSDCGADSVCSSWSCISNTCVSNDANSGTPCGIGKTCDGFGNCVDDVAGCTSDTECNNLDTICKDYSCNIPTGECQFIARNTNTQCQKLGGGTGYCGSDGTCETCTLDTNCPSDTACRNYFCDNSFECDWDPNLGMSCTPTGGGTGTCNAAGACEAAVCTPNCGVAVCGMDPICGTQSCGSCPSGQSCSGGSCITPSTDSGCEFWETEEAGTCEIAPWVYIAGIFMGLMVFLNIIK